MPLDQALAAVAEQADDAARRRKSSPRCARTSPRAKRSPPRSRAGRARSPPLYRGLVAAGAETGRLADVLTRLADYLEARQALKQKFTLALIYPALVTVIALAVIAVLLVYVVPQVVSVYQQSRQTLPWLTQALIAVSAFFRATRLALARWRRGAVVVAFAVANRREAFRARVARGAAARCRSPAGSSPQSTPRASPARSRSSPAAARRCCARSTPRATSSGRCRSVARPPRRRRWCAKACRWRAR